MMKLAHKFVKNIPGQIDPGTLYISVDYLTAVHKCCCGCGNKVVTPITPNDWKLIFDGKTISLSPSIGNWDLQCRSHYWIKNSEVIWEPKFPLTGAEERRRKIRDVEDKKAWWKSIWDFILQR